MRIKRGEQPVNGESTVEEEKYAEAIGNIRKALNSLAPYAKQDEKAKEAVANLAVVLFELK